MAQFGTPPSNSDRFSASSVSSPRRVRRASTVTPPWATTTTSPSSGVVVAMSSSAARKRSAACCDESPFRGTNERSAEARRHSDRNPSMVCSSPPSQFIRSRSRSSVVTSRPSRRAIGAAVSTARRIGLVTMRVTECVGAANRQSLPLGGDRTASGRDRRAAGPSLHAARPAPGSPSAHSARGHPPLSQRSRRISVRPCSQLRMRPLPRRARVECCQR